MVSKNTKSAASKKNTKQVAAVDIDGELAKIDALVAEQKNAHTREQVKWLLEFATMMDLGIVEDTDIDYEHPVFQLGDPVVVRVGHNHTKTLESLTFSLELFVERLEAKVEAMKTIINTVESVGGQLAKSN